jgi:hypothetical protein
MAIRHEFEANSGFRFFKEGVSILLQAATRFRQGTIVTSQDLFHDFQRINKALQDLGAYDGERQGVSNPMTANHFHPHQGREFYKFLPERSLDHYNDGSFQFGSIQYYRNIEHQNSKDSMEGLSNLAIKTPRHLFGMSLVSGYNFGIFCGTSTLNRREEMSARFGPMIIRIANLKLFAESAGGVWTRTTLGRGRVKKHRPPSRFRRGSDAVVSTGCAPGFSLLRPDGRAFGGPLWKGQMTSPSPPGARADMSFGIFASSRGQVSGFGSR